MFHDPAVVRALDVLARPLIEGEILPFDPKPVNAPGVKSAVKSKRPTNRKSPS
jgi:hypothetical protein